MAGSGAAEAVSGPRVLFFGGKGGVGKTTLAGAAALALADDGLRTLLVSTDPAHSTGDLLDLALGDEPRLVTERLWAVEIDPAAEADRYIQGVKDRLADVTPPRLLGEVERQIDIARVTPGAEEAALFDRFARILECDLATHDRLVFDTAPLGHTLRLLALPEQMDAWMAGLVARRRQVTVLGRAWRRVSGAAAASEERADPVLAALDARRARFQQARRLLTDAARCQFHFVLIPERLPILETERAVTTLESYGIRVGSMFVNRVLPDDADGAFLARRRERERAYLRRIDQRLGRYPVVRVPLLDADVAGLGALRALRPYIRPALFPGLG
jgi:arsenite-transporting ATPase